MPKPKGSVKRKREHVANLRMDNSKGKMCRKEDVEKAKQKGFTRDHGSIYGDDSLDSDQIVIEIDGDDVEEGEEDDDGDEKDLNPSDQEFLNGLKAVVSSMVSSSPGFQQVVSEDMYR